MMATPAGGAAVGAGGGAGGGLGPPPVGHGMPAAAAGGQPNRAPLADRGGTTPEPEAREDPAAAASEGLNMLVVPGNSMSGPAGQVHMEVHNNTLQGVSIQFHHNGNLQRAQKIAPGSVYKSQTYVTTKWRIFQGHHSHEWTVEKEHSGNPQYLITAGAATAREQVQAGSQASRIGVQELSPSERQQVLDAERARIFHAQPNETPGRQPFEQKFEPAAEAEARAVPRAAPAAGAEPAAGAAPARTVVRDGTSLNERSGVGAAAATAAEAEAAAAAAAAAAAPATAVAPAPTTAVGGAGPGRGGPGAPLHRRQEQPTVAEMHARKPGATWDGLGGYYYAGALTGSEEVHRERCSLLKAKAICGFGEKTCAGPGCKHDRCIGTSSKGVPIEGVVGFTFEDQSHAGRGGPRPVGKFECSFWGAGVVAHPDSKRHSYVCPGQYVEGTIDASTDAGTGGRRITADNDRHGGRAGSGPAEMCIQCKTKPAFVEQGELGRRVVHDFCSRTCRYEYTSQHPAGRTVPFDRQNPSRLPREIKFYEKTEDFYEFTNFWECDQLVIDGQPWPTSEHYFQAQKFAAWPSLVEHCRKLPSPRECFDMVRDPAYSRYVREDWHRGDPMVKDQVMYNAVMNKFTQDPTLKALLMSTEAGGLPRMIIEHTTNDSYWGDGGVPHWRTGMPGNELGMLLVRIRDEIKHGRIERHGRGYLLPKPEPAAALPPPPLPGIGASAGMCSWCHSKPARDGYPYCGRSCGASASFAGHSLHNPNGGGATAAAAPASHLSGHYSSHLHPAQQPQARVTCPPDAHPGMWIDIQLETGELRRVQIPKNIGPGMDFLVS